MSNDHPITSSSSTQSNSRAKDLGPDIRQNIGLQALAGSIPISHLAKDHQTSRKFIYNQKEIASEALEEAFLPYERDSNVLFHVPVTKKWLEQVVLSLTFACHSSYQGTIEFFRDILDQPISKGNIHNIIYRAIPKALEINESYDLSSVSVGAHDEIFQGRMPVLTGCDVKSTYTYLLKHEEHRDATTWAVHLLDLSDKGLNLDYSVADGGPGLRAGQKEAWPDTPCHGDVFHALYEMGKLTTYLENREKSTRSKLEKVENQMKKAKGKKNGNKFSKALAKAREMDENARNLLVDVSILSSWLHNDILSVTGPEMLQRQELLRFIVDELKNREPECPHRIKPIRSLLENQGDDLLRFAGILDSQLQYVSEDNGVDLDYVREVFELQSISQNENRYWEKSQALYKKLGGHYYGIEESILEIIENTVRASSLVENLNSRLRNYFFLRKNLSGEYLELLQFYLNHRRYMRSSRSERIGKSPAELLTKDSHAHWLELLGYNRFKKSSNQSLASKAA